MRLRRTVVAAGAALALALGAAPAAHASPYNEQCGDGTLAGCISHCMAYHGGLRNLADCLWGHYLV